ncbi:MAG: anti-sigma factor [Chloroflexi bacterium]|nr:anti-sigma factor [Chloroflexota bacterium]
MDCRDVAEAEDAYVWGALDAQQRALVEAHRQECPACERRLAEAERVVSTLDQAQPRLAPPAELRARVLSAIERIPSPASARGDRAEPLPVPPVRVDRASPGHRGSASRGRPRRLGTFASGLATGVAASVALLALAFVLVVRPEALGGLGPSRSGYGSSGEQAPALPPIPIPGGQPSSAAHLIRLTGDGQGVGWLAYDPATSRGVVMVEGQSPAGSTEAVWVTGDGQRVQVGTLPVNENGFGTFTLPDPLPVAHPSRLEVVPEQGGPPLAADLQE